MTDVSLKTFLHPRYWYAWPVLALMLVMSWMPSRVLWVLGSGLGSFVSWFPYFQPPLCRAQHRTLLSRTWVSGIGIIS